MDQVIEEIRSDLKSSIDEKTKNGFQRFFKEPVLCYGIKSSDLQKIAKKYWKVVKDKPKADIFALCENLYQSGICEEAFIVSSWMAQIAERFEISDLIIIKRWIDTYITNWATCDGFCNHAVGDFFEKFPETIPELFTWAESENRWLRRASAVSLIIPVKHGKYLDEVKKIADILLTDSEDMVQKGYGWLLKEASRIHQEDVYNYVMTHKRQMPRTALRYAIELMPPDLRKEAMKKDW